MSPSDDARVALQKRIASRVAALARRRRPNERGYVLLPGGLSPVITYMTMVEDLIRTVWDLRTIVAQVVPAANRRPSHLLVTRDVVVTGKPVGPVHWPLTMKLRVSQYREPAAGLNLVCRESVRRPETPEHVLLVETLGEIHARVQRLERAGWPSLSRTEAALLASMRRATGATLDTAAANLRGSGQRGGATHDGSIKELERRVEARLSGSRPVAPSWARDLMEFRRRKKMQLPPDAPSDTASLYRLLVLLDVLLALREGSELDSEVSGLGNATIDVPSNGEPGSLWSRCYVLRSRASGAVLIVPLYVPLGGRPKVERMLHQLLWNEMASRSLPRWLVFHPLKTRNKPWIDPPRGVDFLEVSTPVHEAETLGPGEIYRWLARPAGEHPRPIDDPATEYRPIGDFH